MYFLVKTIARELVLPPAGPLILAILGAVLLGRARCLGWALLIAGLTALWLLATPWAADGLTRVAERYPALDPSRLPPAQAIVILGGGGERLVAPEFGGPAVDGPLLERLNYGAFLARRTSLPVLISGTAWEAVAMRASLLRDFGVTPRWVDARSHDTYENAHYAAHLLRADRITTIILVSGSTHVWRATHEFSSVGLQVVPAPVGIRSESESFHFFPSPVALMRSHAALYELLGEQARRVLTALGVRERWDPAARVTQ